MVSKDRIGREVLSNTSTTVAKYAWPVLAAPPGYQDELVIQSLYPDHILTIANLWSQRMCKNYVEFLARLPLVTTPATRKKDEALRVNDRFQIEDPAFARMIWEHGLRETLLHGTIDGEPCNSELRKQLLGGDVLGLNSNIRIYRYRKGQFFASHYDESNNIKFDVSPNESIPARTTWTLLIYLTGPETGCIGGETVFYPESASKRSAAPPPVIADLQVGMALLHRHGAECMLHEGLEVTAGEKWVVRSDLCVHR